MKTISTNDERDWEKMKALILIIVIGLLILAAAIWADTALAAAIESTQGDVMITDLSQCWRQYVENYPPDQTVTKFSMFHIDKNGHPAPSCGGAFYSADKLKFRWYPDLGIKCWAGDGCIQNQIINSRRNGKQEVKTIMWTFPDVNGNPRGFYRVAIWNERK